jgi:hypothetical protein
VEIRRLEEAKALVRLYCQHDDGKNKEKFSILLETLQNLFQFDEDASKRVHKERHERRNKYKLTENTAITYYTIKNFIAP